MNMNSYESQSEAQEITNEIKKQLKYGCVIYQKPNIKYHRTKMNQIIAYESNLLQDMTFNKWETTNVNKFHGNLTSCLEKCI